MTLRILLGALGTSLRHPRVWLTLWLVVTATALIAVYPAGLAIDAALARQPAASFHLDQALDADFERLQADAAAPAWGGALFVALIAAWLGGGVLASVGRGRLRYGEWLAGGARLLPRNLRALLLGALAAVLLTWGCERLAHLVREVWLYECDPGESLFGSRLLSIEMALEALDYSFGLLFLGLAFAAKITMARLALLDRRSALLAWLWTCGFLLRHPLRSGGVAAAFAVLWLGLSHAFGEVTVRLLEVQRSVWLGLLCGQVGIATAQVLVVAALVAARELVAAHLPSPPRQENA